MQIVPLPKDEILTKDGATLHVVGYTNFKSKGPAIYCKADYELSSPLITVYFFDIEKINDVRVEFSQSSKIFSALGKVHRKINLPQPNDQISVYSKVDSENGDSFEKEISVTVKGLKLHNKKVGISKGLLIEDKDGNTYLLNEIRDIKRDIGSSSFNKNSFYKM